MTQPVILLAGCTLLLTPGGTQEDVDVTPQSDADSDFSVESDVDDSGPEDDGDIAGDAEQDELDAERDELDAERDGLDADDGDTADSDCEVHCEEGELFVRCSGELDQILMPCLLGCSSDGRTCLMPSNVEPTILDLDGSELEEIPIAAYHEIVVNTDSGEIRDEDSFEILRPEGEGSIQSGIGFYHQDVSETGAGLGIFVAQRVTIPNGTTLSVIGGRAFVLVAVDAVRLRGIIDAGATGSAGGPGGFSGGEPNTSGYGPCAGAVGESVHGCPGLCSSGSGGGGFGGAGGNGGKVSCYIDYSVEISGGASGASCSTEELVPLIGGSGGAGGVFADWVETSDPGAGGGGGGAVQITAGEVIITDGGITVPGDGGGRTISGGGSGGGSGGAILIEARNLTTDVNAYLAANGGGGGGGD